MADNDNKPGGGKPIVHVVPAILTGAAALIAALTTVYVNVRGDRSPPPPPPATPAAQVSAPVPAQAAVAQAAGRLLLQVDRIAVQHDGSPGTTDWRFTVEADGEPLFVFSQDALDDTGGRNVAVPEAAAGKLVLAAGAPVRISVQGWRGSRLRLAQGTPDVRGDGMLGAAGALAPMQVQGEDAGDGAFVFYFSAAASDDTP
ncbi:hypothetical protein MQC88_08395 [Luteimonas sp. 50]|uniref:DUF4115 domain-containing protein n=1 Tax=Cognatiluteimonas sedimenti TaxID=2927791 RepID=A0ABT0A4R1_9GAMM|nr:hypothetical protein [Lysobacter sedimenti]MCJ0825973.1 hypothetical protein [Lysobacter sedimenti]